MKIDEAKEILMDVRAYSASLATFDNRREFANHTYAEIANAILTVINQNNIDKLISKLEDEKFKLYNDDIHCGFDSGLERAKQIVKEFYEGEGMTLDQAIKHCQQVAEEQEKLCKANDSFNFSQPKWRECANEHRQFAEWLKELKAYREIIEQWKYNQISDFYVLRTLSEVTE